MNQLSRRLDRRGGHSFRNHASHGGAQRELSGHKARFWLVSNALPTRTRARIQTPITTLGRLSREHREQHAPSHVSPSHRQSYRRIRDAIRVEKPPRVRDFIHSTASIRSHARDRRRRAPRAQSHRTPLAHTHAYHPHASFSRGVRYANARMRDDAPIARARSVRDPETPPTRVSARAHRPIARRPAPPSRASTRCASFPRIRTARDRDATPNAASATPRAPRRRVIITTATRAIASHRIASHRNACVPYPREGPRRRA